MATNTQLPPLQKPSGSFWNQHKTNVWGTSQKPPPPPPKKTPTYYDNPWEAFDQMGKTTAKQVVDHTKAAGGDILRQLGGEFLLKSAKSKGGELKPGQEINFKQMGAQEKKAAPPPRIETDINYFREIAEAGKVATQKENAELKQQIQDLVIEIQKLAKVVKPLDAIATQAIGPTIVKPGKYHKTFMQHLLSVLRDARKTVDSSGALQMTNSKDKKKKKKSDWWAMAKQHGTQFMMSGESNSSRGAG